ncbi:deoxyguanosinetriphosphate triphosphohydrolase [Arcanobacterium sp. S3PF19]|uniref:deoxyguanosinetriphosphate triphosphohydrolase n=1 Tax=Arcanobacterium sp. S3PF19 TaxID=1219585 RepID=UPI00050E969C|nr:deoxyguanosinetriphosphate triphosphohydrolase [Arcanobacterium sp. S3PF19]
MADMYLAEDRRRFVPEAAKDPVRTDFERDLARVLHSSALRRLGAKTQVLGPESDDFVRTRLTHSLEVAQIGRALAKNLGADPDVVETACLSHDIGHPPFGHNGERALNELSEDIGGFEGNAQTLRVLTRLEQKRFAPTGEPVGLNLTRACTDAVLKYPWERFAGPRGRKSGKFGVYPDDRAVFLWAHGNHGNARCVEAQIMDLADDIAYSVHDVEDAIVRGALNPDFLFTPGALRAGEPEKVVEATLKWYGDGVSGDALIDAYRELLSAEFWPRNFSGDAVSLARLKDLTSDLIGFFVRAVTAATRESFGPEPLRRYCADIVLPRRTKAQIMFLKGLAVYYVMAPRETEPLYYEQRTLLFDLCDAIGEDPCARLEPLFLQFWRSAGNEDLRQRAIIDQIASLTDYSARQWHARYCGMLRN